jgi:hypothetical protein
MDLLSEVLERDVVTLVALLSREVRDGFLTCWGNFSRDIFPTRTMNVSAPPDTVVAIPPQLGQGQGQELPKVIQRAAYWK